MGLINPLTNQFQMQAKLIFITGTDTGAGKTLFTCMGLSHLRNRGIHAMGLKPFCSGSRSDARHIRLHSDHQLSLDEVNPWFFEPPLAPGVMPKRSLVSRKAVEAHIQKCAHQCEKLLVEGAGGLMSPLGLDYHFGHLIQAIRPTVVLTAQNRLGVLNQVLLNCSYLETFMDLKDLHVVLMEPKRPDLSIKSNAKTLRRWRTACKVREIPYLGSNAKSKLAVQQHATSHRRLLASILDHD